MRTNSVTGFPLLLALLSLLSSYIEITALMNSAEAPDDCGEVFPQPDNSVAACRPDALHPTVAGVYEQS